MTTDPAELRRRADRLHAEADRTEDDVLACHLYVRAFRERVRAFDLEHPGRPLLPVSAGIR